MNRDEEWRRLAAESKVTIIDAALDLRESRDWWKAQAFKLGYSGKHRGEPPAEVEPLHVFVPWECPSCGRRAEARRDYVVRCVCGARSSSTPGAVI